MIPGMTTDQEALLITLTRPIVLAQPMAFDKGKLFFRLEGLKYKCLISQSKYVLNSKTTSLYKIKNI